MDREKQEKNPIQVADRLFQTLELLSTEKSMSLSDISSSLRLNKSTVHRLVTSLSHMGYVRQDAAGGEYALTYKIVEIANRLVSMSDIAVAARPYLHDLMEEAQETVHLVEVDGTDAVYIEKVEALGNSVRMISKIGSRIPLFCSGVGKAMAATWDEDRLRALWENSPVRSYTAHTITDYADFLERIGQVRRLGYATDEEEKEIGVRCIAVALTGFKKEATYAVSISAPTARMSDRRIEQLAISIADCKKKIEKELAQLL